MLDVFAGNVIDLTRAQIRHGIEIYHEITQMSQERVCYALTIVVCLSALLQDLHTE